MPKVKQPKQKPTAPKAPEGQRPSMSLNAPNGFAVAKQMTFALRKFADGETIYCQIVSTITISERRGGTGKNAEGKDMEPAHVMEIVEYSKEGEIMHEGEIVRIIVNKIVQDTLEETFPELAYVNRYFAIRKIGKRAGKRYHEFAISELKRD